MTSCFFFFFLFFFFSFTNNLINALPKRGLLYKERICFQREQFFPFRLDRFSEGRQTSFERLIYPGNVPMPLKFWLYFTRDMNMYLRVVLCVLMFECISVLPVLTYEYDERHSLDSRNAITGKYINVWVG